MNITHKKFVNGQFAMNTQQMMRNRIIDSELDPLAQDLMEAFEASMHKILTQYNAQLRANKEIRKMRGILDGVGLSAHIKWGNIQSHWTLRHRVRRITGAMWETSCKLHEPWRGKFGKTLINNLIKKFNLHDYFEAKYKPRTTKKLATDWKDHLKHQKRETSFALWHLNTNCSSRGLFELIQAVEY